MLAARTAADEDAAHAARTALRRQLQNEVWALILYPTLLYSSMHVLVQLEGSIVARALFALDVRYKALFLGALATLVCWSAKKK